MKNKILLIILLFFCTSFTLSQGNYYNQKDDQYKLLGLKRAKELYEAAKMNYDRQLKLSEKQLLSPQELEAAKSRFSDAEVNYHQSLLAVIFENQYITVTNAIKYQAKDGKKHVRLTLSNSTSGSAEFQKLLNIDDKVFRALQPDVINNVYTSLLNNDNAIISQPYEVKINAIKYDSPVTIDFILLQDLDAVQVSMIYGNGTQRTRKIYLQKDASVDRVIIQAEQFSQEVELGKSANFSMNLELFSGTNNTFKLEVLNLPNQINRYFTDPISRARLSQFKFTENINTRKVELQVFLPDRPTDDVQIDKIIPFYVVVIPTDKMSEIEKLSGKEVTQSDLEKLNIGYVKLELISRGNGKIIVRAPQLYYSIYPDETVEVGVEIVNDGSRRLDNVEVQADPPLNWSKEIFPAVISKLEIREEKKVLLKFKPTSDVSVGKYEIRLKTTSFSNNQPINADEKTISIEIKDKSNILGTIIIVVIILSLITGLVIFGIRLSKK